MRRPIDVLFVEPKTKRLVVLHQDKFWQLPSMNVSRSSWILKLLYKGSLNDIFVSKNQHISCPFTSQILSPKPLPEQLHGISANRFLGWWETNSHNWVSVNPTTQTTDPATDQAKERPKTVINPAALQAVQKSQKSVATTQDTTKSTAQQAQKKPSVQQTTATPTDKKPQENKELSGIQSPTNTNESEDDIFDTLLLELTHDVLHQSG